MYELAPLNADGGGLRELSLFTGIGGGILGSVLLGWRTVCAVERSEYRRAVLLSRQDEGILPPFPIWDDVRNFDGRPWRGLVDVVSGGFPCPPFSVAGKRKSDADERNMWPDTARIIGEVRPRFAFLENVAGLLSARSADGRPYIGRILGDLAEIGYDAVWDCVPASAVGAPHRRDRLWILAYANTDRLRQWADESERVPECCDPADIGIARKMADPTGRGLRIDGGAQGNTGHLDERGKGVANADGTRQSQ